MEIIMTVLITLLVVALAGAGINLVRLNRKAEELDTIQMDMEDISNRIDRMIENLERDLSTLRNEITEIKDMLRSLVNGN